MLKNHLPFVIMACFLIFTLIACEEFSAPKNNKDVALRLEGQWKCTESSSIFKSTGISYLIYLTPSEFDSSQIVIENFYNLGDAVVAVAQVDGSRLVLNNQKLEGGFFLSGIGAISENLQTIAWEYSIDDGSGEKDMVNATYTYLY